MNLIGEAVFETTGASITIRNEGIVAATANYRYSNHNGDALVNARQFGINKVGNRDKHDDYSHLLCVNASVNNSGPYCDLSLNYRGIPTGVKLTQIKVSLALSEEPIDTHPDFKTFAGEKDAPKNGAVFNDDGSFKEFAIDEDLACPPTFNSNKYQGVQSYLAPSMIVQKVETNGSPDTSLDDIGTIYTSTRIGAHETSDGQSLNLPSDTTHDFLLVGASSQFVGKGQIVNYRYRRSGREKWNDEIYD